MRTFGIKKKLFPCIGSGLAATADTQDTPTLQNVNIEIVSTGVSPIVLGAAKGLQAAVGTEASSPLLGRGKGGGFGVQSPHSILPLVNSRVQNHDQEQSKWLASQSFTNSMIKWTIFKVSKLRCQHIPTVNVFNVEIVLLSTF